MKADLPSVALNPTICGNGENLFWNWYLWQHIFPRSTCILKSLHNVREITILHKAWNRGGKADYLTVGLQRLTFGGSFHMLHKWTPLKI